MLLERSDMQSWTSALVRKLMWLGAFYALLVYGRFWIPAIIDSFELIGQRASGSGPLSPSDVFSRGLDLAGALMATSSAAAFFTNLGTSLTMVVTGIITALAFIAITVQFLVAMVESYIHCRCRVCFSRIWRFPLDRALRRAIHRIGSRE